MSEKRKLLNLTARVVKKSRRSITLEDKMEVIRRMENGDGRPRVCRDMNLPPSTVTTIMKNAEKIKCSMLQATSISATQASYTRGRLVEQMEKLLTLWVEDLNQNNIPLSQAIIREKAKSIFDELKEKEGGDETFVGSKGWFEGFKNRSLCHSVKLTSSDIEAAKAFPAEFQAIVQSGEYQEDLIFNVDATGLYWKRMPSRTFMAIEEKSALGFKAAKDRLTLLLGSNVSGTLKLKPMLVYHSETPRALNGLNKLQLPVYWKSNKKAWVTQELFLDWYTNHFCDVVYNYCIENDLPPKALLLLDNGPGHPQNLDGVQTKLKVQVVYLPPNTTSVLQPINQGVIATFKAHYLQESIKKMVTVLDTNHDMTVKDYWRSFNILNAVHFIDIAWKKVSTNCLNAVWKELLPESRNNFEGSGAAEESAAVIQEVLKFAGEAGLYAVREDDVLELIVDRKGDDKGLSTEELADLADHLDTQIEDKKNKDEPECVMDMIKTDELKQFLANANSLIEECCELDHDWERSDFLRRSLSEALTPYYEILRERKRKTRQTIMDSCLRKVYDPQPDPSLVDGPRPGPSSRK